jgi:hypothetical protein
MSNTTYRHTPDLEVHETDDGLVVFDPRTDQVHHLNHSAGVIFEMCRNEQSADQLIDLITELYELEIPPTESVMDGLKKLVEQGVLLDSGGR